MKSLRTQLLASHLALVGLMALVMAGAVANFFRLGDSIDRILRDNLKSVIAAQTMKESLERMNSATTFFLAGERTKARQQFEAHTPVFREALETQRGNITERGERALSEALTCDYARYETDARRLLQGQTDGARYYFSVLEPSFSRAKKGAQAVLELNQKAIEAADLRAREQAREGALIGVAMTLAALGLAVFLANRTINSALTPLSTLASGAQEIGKGHFNRKIEVGRDDEIGVLARAFNDMAARLLEARKVEKRRLHQAQKMSDAALESLFDPVVVCDPDARIVGLNRAAQGVFGPLVNLKGLPISRAIPQPQIVAALENAILHGQTSAPEAEFFRLGERDYRLRAAPMRDDDPEKTPLGGALVLEDVTHLQTLDKLKTEFISVASHELKTPVASLMLSAQLLEEGAAGELSPSQKEIIALQRADLARLDSLLKELLDLTRLEAGATPPRFEWHKPQELLRQAARAIETGAREKGVELRTFAPDDLPQIRADASQIERVLLNLLANALRHTPKSGEIRLEALAGEGEKVRFVVSDNGEGIAPQFHDKIFERFVQVPGATGGGSGLGLAISQALVQNHGGEIHLESEAGKGAHFWFEI